jgi:hypothetical protein
MPGPKTTVSRAEIAERIRAAGERAKAEAEVRRKSSVSRAQPTEIGGRDGPEPTRYGDWERNGIISDF